MRPSKLSEHIIEKDVIKTPLNAAFGDMLSQAPWCYNSLPEYLWMALIINSVGREKGFHIFSNILYELEGKEICLAEMSRIIALSKEQQNEFFDIIDKYIPVGALSPLTVVFRENEYSTFYNRYSMSNSSIEERIDTLTDVIMKLISQESRIGLDVRFLAIQFRCAKGELCFVEGTDSIIEVLGNYHCTDPGDARMPIYDSSIRAMTNAFTACNKNQEYIVPFWDTLSTLTPCNPMLMKYESNEVKESEMEDFLKDIEKAMAYIQATLGEKAINLKYTVIIGIVTYVVKLFSEMVYGGLYNKASGRIVFRTILEAYINLKYLILKESEDSNIYEAFREYGLGKYKLIMKKVKENKYPGEEPSQYNADVLGLYTSELGNEEFLDIGIGYFDKTNIKERFTEVKELALYELYYEYNTNYAHSFWGAIRESSMLLCDNPAHLYHSVPDFTFEQTLLSVYPDCRTIIIRMFKLISEEIELPEEFCKNYEV